MARRTRARAGVGAGVGARGRGRGRRGRAWVTLTLGLRCARTGRRAGRRETDGVFVTCVVNTSVRVPTTAMRRGDAQKTRAVKKTHLPTTYEGVLLLRPDCDDATRSGALDQFKAMFNDGLASWEQTERGLQPNAYEIKGYPDAYQVVVNFSCPPAAFKNAYEELSKPVVGQEEVILRSMFLKSA